MSTGKIDYLHNNPVRAGLVEKPEDYLVSVHKVPFAALRLSKNCSFTDSKLRIFGLRKPCKWNSLNRHMTI